MRAMVGGVSLELPVLCNNIAATVTPPSLKPVFMMQTTKDRTGYDAQALWNAMPVCS